MTRYIHQLPEWPGFRWAEGEILKQTSAVAYAQGQLLGGMAELGLEVKQIASQRALTAEITSTAAIEGESLNIEAVRSSLAQRLGLPIAGLPPKDRHAEGMVEMMLDATLLAGAPLTEERLHNWHGAIFPTGRSGLLKIRVAQWRTDDKGPMQVISGGYGREVVHFEAPPASKVAEEMDIFLDWFNTDDSLDGNLKAGIAHLWFLTIHPYEDGNGRIGRAIGELQLARADGSPHRFYSLSKVIHHHRKEYYSILEHTQKGNLDITGWLAWFLARLEGAIRAGRAEQDKVLEKERFWRRQAHLALNPRQIKMLNLLLDDFDGKLTVKKWAAMCKCSPDTALRDIQSLVNLAVLAPGPAGGRSTHYLMVG